MDKNIFYRWILIVLVLLFVGYKLWPTYRYYTLSSEEKIALKKTKRNIIKKLGKDAINLGLDLQGGMHVVLEVDIPNLIKKLATTKTPELLDAISNAEIASINNGTDFFDELYNISNKKALPLKRLFSNLISSTGNTSVIEELKNQGDKSRNLALDSQLHVKKTQSFSWVAGSMLMISKYGGRF